MSDRQPCCEDQAAEQQGDRVDGRARCVADVVSQDQPSQIGDRMGAVWRVQLCARVCVCLLRELACGSLWQPARGSKLAMGQPHEASATGPRPLHHTDAVLRRSAQQRVHDSRAAA